MSPSDIGTEGIAIVIGGLFALISAIREVRLTMREIRLWKKPRKREK